MIKSKKGGEKYLSIWWFFCLAIIAGGIVVGVLAMNVSDISTKELESNILVSRVANCIIDNGYMNEEFLSEDFNVFQECYLDKEVINKKGGKFYLSYELYRKEDCNSNEGIECEEPIVKEEFGNTGFPKQCGIKEGVTASRYPKCSEAWIYTLNKEEEKMVLHLKAGSNQVIKQVSLTERK